MKRAVLSVFSLATTFALMNTSPISAQHFTPPATPSRPVTEVLHGVSLTDPYRWLENSQDPDVVKWTREQHDVTQAWLDKNTPPIPGLREELTRYIDRTVISPPAIIKGREFFTRQVKGEAQTKYYTRIDGKEVLLFDPMKLDPSGKSSLSGMSFTRDARIAAVAIQKAGNELPTQYFIDTSTGAEVYPPLAEVSGVSWTQDNVIAYVTPRTAEQVAKQQPLFTQRVDLRRPVKDQPIVQQLKDAKEVGGVYDFEYAPYTLYARGDFQTQQMALARTGSNAAPQVIFNQPDARATIEIIGDTLYAWTNADAPNGRLLKGDARNPDFKHWKEILPERKDVVLTSFVVTRKHVIVSEKRDLIERLRILDFNGKQVRELDAPEFGSVGSVSYDRDNNMLYVVLSTFGAPSKLYKMDADHFDWQFVWQDDSVFDTSLIETKLVKVKSRDGTEVPMFVSYRKGVELNGKNPALLYGYGGFNVGIRVGDLGVYAALINRGVVFAWPGLRGGDEYGEAWHEGGMRANKQNVFDDFYASAEWLIANGYTRPSQLVAFGGSNGGLLTGAAATQRPDLFKAIISGVPLLDMVRFHKFRIARYWIPEYGDPDQTADFNWLLRYSPYHNIRQGVSLPTTLVTAAENDTRVDPLHAKKFVAMAQNHVGQTNPVLLKMDYDAGHGSGKSTAQQVEESETWLRFVLAMSRAQD